MALHIPTEHVNASVSTNMCYACPKWSSRLNIYIIVVHTSKLIDAKFTVFLQCSVAKETVRLCQVSPLGVTYGQCIRHCNHSCPSKIRQHTSVCVDNYNKGNEKLHQPHVLCGHYWWSYYRQVPSNLAGIYLHIITTNEIAMCTQLAAQPVHFFHCMT